MITLCLNNIGDSLYDRVTKTLTLVINITISPCSIRGMHLAINKVSSIIKLSRSIKVISRTVYLYLS